MTTESWKPIMSIIVLSATKDKSIRIQLGKLRFLDFFFSFLSLKWNFIGFEHQEIKKFCLRKNVIMHKNMIQLFKYDQTLYSSQQQHYLQHSETKHVNLLKE